MALSIWAMAAKPPLFVLSQDGLPLLNILLKMCHPFPDVGT